MAGVYVIVDIPTDPNNQDESAAFHLVVDSPSNIATVVSEFVTQFPLGTHVHVAEDQHFTHYHSQISLATDSETKAPVFV